MRLVRLSALLAVLIMTACTSTLTEPIKPGDARVVPPTALVAPAQPSFGGGMMGSGT